MLCVSYKFGFCLCRLCCYFGANGSFVCIACMVKLGAAGDYLRRPIGGTGQPHSHGHLTLRKMVERNWTGWKSFCRPSSPDRIHQTLPRYFCWTVFRVGVLLEPEGQVISGDRSGGQGRSGFSWRQCLFSLSHSGTRQILVEGKRRWATD